MREHFKVGLLVGRQHGKDVLFDAVSLGHAHQCFGALSHLGTAHFGNRFAGAVACGVMHDAIASLTSIKFLAEFLKNVFNHNVSFHKLKRKNILIINASRETKIK